MNTVICVHDTQIQKNCSSLLFLPFVLEDRKNAEIDITKLKRDADGYVYAMIVT